jgi:hypothetical protein
MKRRSNSVILKVRSQRTLCLAHIDNALIPFLDNPFLIKPPDHVPAVNLPADQPSRVRQRYRKARAIDFDRLEFRDNLGKGRLLRLWHAQSPSNAGIAGPSLSVILARAI